VSGFELGAVIVRDWTAEYRGIGGPGGDRITFPELVELYGSHEGAQVDLLILWTEIPQLCVWHEPYEVLRELVHYVDEPTYRAWAKLLSAEDEESALDVLAEQDESWSDPLYDDDGNLRVGV
jgi:hypothetical protein